MICGIELKKIFIEIVDVATQSCEGGRTCSLKFLNFSQWRRIFTTHAAKKVRSEIGNEVTFSLYADNIEKNFRIFRLVVRP
uniref:Uncharacterized protein n=1 Tax=Glossina morsitans morsitans TaxID=37546 RepID=A0A1B0GBN9_GLOMM